MEKRGIIKYKNQVSSQSQNPNNSSPLYEKFTRLKIYSPESELQNVFTNLHLDEIFVNKHPHFVCQICLSFVINPVSCSICETIYCNHCILEYSKHNQRICPNRCNLIIKPLNRILRNMLEEIKMDCLFKIKGCNEKLKYDTYIPHINECELGPHMCLAKDCLYVETKSKIISHVKYCEYFDEENNEKDKGTSYQVKIAKNLHSNLKNNHSSAKEKNCVYCKNSFKEDILSIHTFICEGQLVICKSCDKKMSLKEFKKHEEKIHSNCLVNQYERQIEFLEDKFKYFQNVVIMLKNETKGLKEKCSNSGNQNDLHLWNREKINSLLVEKNIEIQICDNLLHESKIDRVEFSSKLNNENENFSDLQNLYLQDQEVNINSFSKIDIIHSSDKEILLPEEKTKNLYSKNYLETKLPLQIDNTISIVNQEENNICFYSIDSYKFLPNKFYFEELEGEQITCLNYIKHLNRNLTEEYFIFSTDGGNLFIYKILENFTLLEFYKKHKVLETSVKFLRNYKIKFPQPEGDDELIFLVIGGMYSNLILYDFKTLDKVGELDHRNKSVLSFVYLKYQNENILISTTKDSLIRVWSHEVTKKLNENSEGLNHNQYISKFTFKEFLKGHKDYVWTLENIDNIYIASGSGDKSILVWGCEIDPSNSNSNFILKKTLSGHKDSVTCLKSFDILNTGRRFLFSGSFDGEIKLWRINSISNQDKIIDLEFENILSIFPQNRKINNIFIYCDNKLASIENSSKFNCDLKMISDGESQNLISSNFKIILCN
jgi:hypothetical protein